MTESNDGTSLEKNIEVAKLLTLKFMEEEENPHLKFALSMLEIDCEIPNIREEDLLMLVTYQTLKLSCYVERLLAQFENFKKEETGFGLFRKNHLKTR